MFYIPLIGLLVDFLERKKISNIKYQIMNYKVHKCFIFSSLLSLLPLTSSAP